VTLRIRSKLFLIALGLIALSIGVAYFYMRSALEDEVVAEVRAELGRRAELVALQASGFGPALAPSPEWDALADDLGRRAGARVTLVRHDGIVVGDSEVPLAGLEQVENHAGRSEVRDALERGVGESARFSATVERRMIYVGVPFQRGGQLAGVARVALPLTAVDAAVARLRRSLTIAGALALAVAIAMSSIAAQLASRKARSLTLTARQMAKGDLAVRTHLAPGRDEFGELGHALDQLAGSLSSTLSELLEERDRLSGILSGMTEGVLVLDGDGLVTLMNPALREMLMLGADSLGKSPIEVIRNAELAELLQASSSDKAPASRELELGGFKPRRLLVRAAPLAGEPAGMFAIFVDVTERRRLETMRRDFVANVSHELRTPIAAIRSAAETLESVHAKDPPAAARFVEIIDRNAARLHGLVEDLLDLSRIESREFRLNLEPLELEPLLLQIVSLFRERAEKKQIRLRIEPAAELPCALADRRALEHVLTNLIDNAVKYCGPGAEVRIGAALQDGGVRVQVSDTGPGIEPRHLPRLFERFYRVDAGRSRELGGTGLGLSIAKNLVEAMGSTLDVSSELGAGTTFGFTLAPA
jgi:two-component system, OmpR family, phosphate regulon sensor histidine kinase PhoR